MISKIIGLGIIAWLVYGIYSMLRGKNYKELSYFLLFIIGFCILYYTQLEYGWIPIPDNESP